MSAPPLIERRFVVVSGKGGVGRTTVYQLMASGELKSIKIGRSRRIPAAALEEYVGRLVQGAA